MYCTRMKFKLFSIATLLPMVLTVADETKRHGLLRGEVGNNYFEDDIDEYGFDEDPFDEGVWNNTSSDQDQVDEAADAIRHSRALSVSPVARKICSYYANKAVTDANKLFALKTPKGKECANQYARYSRYARTHGIHYGWCIRNKIYKQGNVIRHEHLSRADAIAKCLYADDKNVRVRDVTVEVERVRIEKTGCDGSPEEEWDFKVRLSRLPSDKYPKDLPLRFDPKDCSYKGNQEYYLTNKKLKTSIIMKNSHDRQRYRVQTYGKEDDPGSQAEDTLPSCWKDFSPGSSGYHWYTCDSGGRRYTIFFWIHEDVWGYLFD